MEGGIYRPRPSGRHFTLVVTLLFSLLVSLNEIILTASAEVPISFTNVTAASGLAVSHGYTNNVASSPVKASGGVAATDYDRDGWVDLYLVRGDIGSNLLFRNNGNGTFTEVAESAGVNVDGNLTNGPFFGDYDGDGWADLLVGGVEGAPMLLFHNQGDGTFQDTTDESGLLGARNNFSASMGDYDRDGDLDLILAHWTFVPGFNSNQHLWKNNGDGTFTPLSDEEAGITGYEEIDYTLTPNFADINSDGWPDILMAADFGHSQVYLNNTDGSFINITDQSPITDENGMGAAIADYDHDGDLDWFVSSIWDDEPSAGWGVTGNRLYKNLGDGRFEDATDEAGVRIGYWGWGSCFADFNNDGHLDLVHVNGFEPLPARNGTSTGQKFLTDPTRLFLSDGDGTFTEKSYDLGVRDSSQGRGVVCFDYDRDGDIDLFIANYSAQHVLYRNDGGNQNNYLALELNRRSPGVPSVGTRVYLKANGYTQLQELQAGNNYLSQQPAELHFGVSQAETIEELRIEWPDGQVEVYTNLPTNQRLILNKPGRSLTQQVISAVEPMVFPHVPVGESIEAILTLINPHSSRAVTGILEIFDQHGNPRGVEIDGHGSGDSFSFGPDLIPPGGSLALKLTDPDAPPGAFGFGQALFTPTLPVEGIFRFQFGEAHIGIPAAPRTRFATISVLTDQGFDTGIAIANPLEEPISIRLVLLDSAGTVVEILDHPDLNPLAPRGEFVGFVSNLGLAQIEGRSDWTLQILADDGSRFCAIALVSGLGVLSSAPVVSGASSQLAFEQLHGSYSGEWASGETRGAAALVLGVVGSANHASFRLQMDRLDTTLSELALGLLGSYDDGGFFAGGPTGLFNSVHLSIQADGTLTLGALGGADGWQSFSLAGKIGTEGLNGTYVLVRAGGERIEGALGLDHLGR